MATHTNNLYIHTGTCKMANFTLLSTVLETAKRYLITICIDSPFCARFKRSFR